MNKSKFLITVVFHHFKRLKKNVRSSLRKYKFKNSNLTLKKKKNSVKKMIVKSSGNNFEKYNSYFCIKMFPLVYKQNFLNKIRWQNRNIILNYKERPGISI